MYERIMFDIIQNSSEFLLELASSASIMGVDKVFIV
jgi:hypothetical protein